MHSTDLVPDLLSTSCVATARLIADFDAAPSPSSLFGVSAVAEILALANSELCTASLMRMLSDGAARWLRSGVLEELCFSRVELTYATSLLVYLAQFGYGYTATDLRPLERLCEGRLIGRSEMPVLTQQIVAGYLTRCGMRTDFGDTGRRDVATLVDKRVLRARSDEYDLQVLLMCAQLLRLNPGADLSKPALYPRMLLAQALRSGNANWLPVLAFLCAGSFSLDGHLRTAAAEAIRQIVPPSGELLPPPQGAGLDVEYIERASQGLRIRSTIALALSLETLGDSYAEDRTFVAVG